MTLSSLSPTQRTVPQEDFDRDKVRTLIAEYLRIDAKLERISAGLNWDSLDGLDG